MNALGIKKTRPSAINTRLGFFLSRLNFVKSALVVTNIKGSYLLIVQELSVAFQPKVILHLPGYLGFVSV